MPSRDQHQSNHITNQTLEGTAYLEKEGELWREMLGGIDRYLATESERLFGRRDSHWNPDFGSREAYSDSIDPNRERFRELIGLRDKRDPPSMELINQSTGEKNTDGITVSRVRWHVFRGVYGEGYLLEPAESPMADIVAIGDCDQTPEAIAGLSTDAGNAFAAQLAIDGFRVLVPTLIDRSRRFSGLPGMRKADMPMREILWRAAYEMGRTLVGYEVQKVLSVVDWFKSQNEANVGVVGYGEGGLIAFYAAAADTRIDSACVSGYFHLN